MPNGDKTKTDIPVRYRKLGLGLVGTGINILTIVSLTYRTGHVQIILVYIDTLVHFMGEESLLCDI
jgi:hypothetical protein